MKLAEVASQKQIALVCGNLASGKGHYAQTYFPGAEVIGVSSVVKELTNFKTRSELSTTASLDTVIAKTLIEKIEDSSNPKIVVDGIRQLSILKALQHHFGTQIKDIIWLDVDEKDRRERFSKRDSGKDDMSFDKSVQTDKALGIDQVEDYIRKNHRVIPY